MPIKAVTHIQNTAPGPPSLMAIATPAMLPTPTRLAAGNECLERCDSVDHHLVCGRPAFLFDTAPEEAELYKTGGNGEKIGLRLKAYIPIPTTLGR